MFTAKMAIELRQSYFEKGNAESQEWLKQKSSDIEKSIAAAAMKGNDNCEFHIEFEKDDPWQLARTVLIKKWVNDAGYYVEVSERSVQQNDVLKKPVTHLYIAWKSL